MQAIILTAGKDERLGLLVEEIPEALLEIEGKTILGTMLEKLTSLNLEEVIIVVGYKHEMIREKFGDSYKEMKIRYVINEDYSSTNVIYSLWLAKDYLQGGFLLIDGDVVCEAELLKKIVEAEEKNVMLVDFESKLEEEEMKVKVVRDQIVAIGKDLKCTPEAKYAEVIGINKFGKDFTKRYFEIIDNLIKEGKVNLYYEDAIQLFLEEFKIKCMNVKGFNWIEIDFLEEFKKAKRLFSNINILKKETMRLGATNAKVIALKELVFDIRAKLKCRECEKYGRVLTCPPYPDDFNIHELLGKYERGLIVTLQYNFGDKKEFDKLRLSSSNKLHGILLALERMAYDLGYFYTTSFIGGSCRLCSEDCSSKCKFANLIRKPLEGVGIDVVETLKKFGMEIKFPVKRCFHRIGLLLVG
jgi:choline kinase